MDKKKSILVIIGVFVIGIMAFFLGGNTELEEPVKEPVTLTQAVYFVNKETSSLASEERALGGKTLLEVLESAVFQMQVPPKSEALTIAVPEGLEILNITLEEGVASVNVSSEYSDLKIGEEMFFRAAIVWTLTDFYFVDKVEIFVEGVSLKKISGEPVGPIGRDELIIDAQIDPQPTNASRVLKLYFADSNANNLVVEERRIEINPNQPIERYIMEQLILGPKEAGNISTVPVETKIRDIQTQDGVCYVDLSQEFVLRHGGGSTGELFTIYSIVNSLCELPEVERVQFLVEGEKQDEYKGHVEFSKPFEPSYYY